MKRESPRRASSQAVSPSGTSRVWDAVIPSDRCLSTTDSPTIRSPRTCLTGRLRRQAATEVNSVVVSLRPSLLRMARSTALPSLVPFSASSVLGMDTTTPGTSRRAVTSTLLSTPSQTCSASSQASCSLLPTNNPQPLRLTSSWPRSTTTSWRKIWPTMAVSSQQATQSPSLTS